MNVKELVVLKIAACFLVAHAVIVIIFVACDYALLRMEFGLLRAVVDNVCHALICAVMWFAVVCRQFVQSNSIPNNVASIVALNHVFQVCNITVSVPFWIMEMFYCSMIGSFIDVDHFIEAQSLSFFHATQLTHRPFAHNLLFCLVGVILVQVLFHRFRFTILVGCSLLSHLLRDSTRRGLWCWPWTTAPLTFLQVIACFFCVSGFCSVIVFGDYKKMMTPKAATAKEIARTVDNV